MPDLALPALRGLEGPTPYQADWRPAFPGAASEHAGEYRLGAAPIAVYAAFYSVQAHGAKLFGPDSSIAGRGPWKERARRIRRLPGAAIETILVDDEGRARLVWHWFEVRGERLTSGAQVKLRQSLAAFGLPARSGVVAISARCEPDCARAGALLAEVYRHGLGNWTVSAPLRGVAVQAGTGRRHDLNPGAPPDLSIRTAIAPRVVQSPKGLYRRRSPPCILGLDSHHLLHFPVGPPSVARIRLR
jgi:EpsI family protein